MDQSVVRKTQKGWVYELEAKPEQGQQHMAKNIAIGARKRTKTCSSLALHDKLSIIMKMKSGESTISDIAKEFRVKNSTISYLWRKANKSP